MRGGNDVQAALTRLFPSPQVRLRGLPMTPGDSAAPFFSLSLHDLAGALARSCLAVRPHHGPRRPQHGPRRHAGQSVGPSGLNMQTLRTGNIRAGRRVRFLGHATSLRARRSKGCSLLIDWSFSNTRCHVHPAFSLPPLRKRRHASPACAAKRRADEIEEERRKRTFRPFVHRTALATWRSRREPRLLRTTERPCRPRPP